MGFPLVWNVNLFSSFMYEWKINISHFVIVDFVLKMVYNRQLYLFVLLVAFQLRATTTESSFWSCWGFISWTSTSWRTCWWDISPSSHCTYKPRLCTSSKSVACIPSVTKSTTVAANCWAACWNSSISSCKPAR